MEREPSPPKIIALKTFCAIRDHVLEPCPTQSRDVTGLESPEKVSKEKVVQEKSGKMCAKSVKNSYFDLRTRKTVSRL